MKTFDTDVVYEDAFYVVPFTAPPVSGGIDPW
jgi:hypothetical protein